MGAIREIEGVESELHLEEVALSVDDVHRSPCSCFVLNCLLEETLHEVHEELHILVVQRLMTDFQKWELFHLLQGLEFLIPEELPARELRAVKGNDPEDPLWDADGRHPPHDGTA